jgi:AcrR family transcriptional regulator
MTRSDAARNRERLLAVARDAYAASPDVSLNAIAKAAGVGPGTLYRHFPTREALVLAVYEEQIAQLVALAPALLEEHADAPVEAARRWLEALGRYGRLKHGIAEVLHAAMTEAIFRSTYFPMVDALRQLLQAGERAGAFRPGTDPDDLLLLLGFLWRMKPGEASEAQATRLIGFVLRGLGATEAA